MEMREHILVVEDEPSIAENICYALETEGFTPQHCSTLGEAETAFTSGSWALVLLDVGLPDGNGFEWCKALRTKSAVPVIFLTARDGEIDRVVGLEIGGDDYVVKPFSPRELTARVKAALRRAGQGPWPGVTVEGKPTAQNVEPTAQSALVIDDERKRISFHGQALELSRVEYGLLAQLASRPGRVYSRNELMERVWPEPDASLDRTVDTHIKTLRAKLREVHTGEDPIVTHRGMGYALREGV